MDDGWESSAGAWIADMAGGGDYGRRHVLDEPMLERIRLAAPVDVLDLGCGEGRFCRRLSRLGVRAVGIDPTTELIEHARRRDPEGDYRIARGEDLPFGNGEFDLVVCYLSLIDIADIDLAIDEMVRVLHPGGRLLIANLTSFYTAGLSLGWIRLDDGRSFYGIDDYLAERAEWVSWRGIRVQNWHRPLSAYMARLLARGLILTHFDEPAPKGGDVETAQRYVRAPWFLIMEWRKPGD